jgi:hypothetical protein
MKFRVEVVCLNDDGEQRCSVMEMERADLAMETLGLSVAEGKTMLHGVQDFVERGRVGQRLHAKVRWVGMFSGRTVLRSQAPSDKESLRRRLRPS